MPAKKIVTDPEIRMLKGMFRRFHRLVVKDLEPQRKAGMIIPDALEHVIAGDNMLRDCCTVALECMQPIPVSSITQTAIRIASTLISAMPLEMQETALAQVIEELPAAHKNRMQIGLHLHVSWRDEQGVVHKNVPDKGDVN